MKLKFCGFQSEEDVQNACQLNIDAIGFIHYPPSKRHVSIEQIKILSTIVPEHIDRVAVVVNPSFNLVVKLITTTHINTIQFHGHESIELLQQIHMHFPNVKLIKALPGNDQLKDNIAYYQSYVHSFIIDTPSINYGGTGKIFDWNILNNLNHIPYLIAGGLNETHIMTLQNYNLNHQGYDIASGIETNFKKDINKMQRLVHLVKGAI